METQVHWPGTIAAAMHYGPADSHHTPRFTGARTFMRLPSIQTTDDVDVAVIARDAGMVENETVQQVRKAIAKLPEHFRAALVLCEYENMSYQQIADTIKRQIGEGELERLALARIARDRIERLMELGLPVGRARG